MEPKFRPDEKRIEELLDSLQPNPTLRFYARMASAPWVGAALGSQANTRNRFLALFLLVLLLTLAAFALTPRSHVLAGQFLEFFTQARSTPFPLPPEQPKQSGSKPAAETTIIARYPWLRRLPLLLKPVQG